jgi:hypothetical protein
MKAEREREREREKRRGKVSVVVVYLVYCEAITALETTISQVSDTQLLAEPFIYIERDTHTSTNYKLYMQCVYTAGCFTYSSHASRVIISAWL